MKKYLMLISVVMAFSFTLQAKGIINEYMNDIYFANGINTSEPEAKKQLLYIIKPAILKEQFNFNEEKMNQTVTFKLEKVGSGDEKVGSGDEN